MKQSSHEGPFLPRQENATAEKLETEARISKLEELEARLAFLEKLRKVGVAPVWDIQGNMRFVKVPSNFDWDSLTSQVISATDLQLAADAEKPKSSERVAEPAGDPEKTLNK